MKKVLSIVVLTFLWCNLGIAKNITILFSSEKEVALLSKQTPLSDKVYYRANAAGAEHCKKHKKYAFRSSIGMRKSEIERYYKSKGYKIGKGFSKKPQLLHYVCSKNLISYMPSWASYDVGNEIDYNNYGDRSVAILIQEEENKKRIAEKPKQKTTPNNINIHQILLDNKLVVLWEGERWSLQFMPNNRMSSSFRGETNYDVNWNKINENGSYEIRFKGVKDPRYFDINLKSSVMKVTGADNKHYSAKILEPKLETSVAEKPKKEKPKKSPDDNKIVAASSGTGFYVSNTGHIISNHHVVEGCDTVKLTYKGKEVSADILAVDKMNDLAILKVDIAPTKIYPVATEDAPLLEDIIVAGYPLGKKVSAAIKTSKGSITALAGLGDNFSEFQTDAALNKGNSGGPIMNQKGNVVGVAVSHYGKTAGVESFNFGIKSSTLKTFANANGLEFLPPNNRDLSNKDLGKLITEATIYLECHMTIAKIKKLIAEEENRKAFFSEYK